MPRWTTGAARAALAGLAALTTTLLLAGAIGAQSPAPPSPQPTCGPGPMTCPTPTPDSGIEWPPMRFEGSSLGQMMVFTSSCGVWGQDPIALHGEGQAGSAELVVTFDQYETESSQWFGRVTGSYTAPNGNTTPVDDAALIYYAFDLGRWVLVASHAAQVVASACAPLPSASG